MIRSLLLSTCLLSLTACITTKEELGLTRRTPDEFAVAPHAPLQMPPDFILHPPTPGAPRPQETAPAEQAANALWGTPSDSTRGKSSVENIILQKTGATDADSRIRQQIEAESDELTRDKRPALYRILGLGGGSSKEKDVIDPEAEATRIKPQKQVQQ